jgi:hypothetical protein
MTANRGQKVIRRGQQKAPDAIQPSGANFRHPDTTAVAKTMVSSQHVQPTSLGWLIKGGWRSSIIGKELSDFAALSGILK